MTEPTDLHAEYEALAARIAGADQALASVGAEQRTVAWWERYWADLLATYDAVLTRAPKGD